MTSTVTYDGNLRTVCQHLRSGSTIETDAPVDNNGKGERFSPSDLVSKFRSLGIPVKTAADSQSLIELRSQYCDKKRCLDCSIANALLKKV